MYLLYLLTERRRKNYFTVNANKEITTFSSPRRRHRNIKNTIYLMQNKDSLE